MLSITSSARLLSQRGFILSSRAWLSTESNNDFLTGVVKFYDKRKAWGIVVGNDNKEYYIHRRSIVSWLPPQEDIFHPYLVATEKVRFQSQNKEGKTNSKEATNLTYVDGSQVLAYRSNYLSGNKKRMSHIFGERVYYIMEHATLSDEQKHTEIAEAFQNSKEKMDVYVAMVEKQSAALRILPTAQSSENETQVENENIPPSVEQVQEETISSTS